MVDITLRSAKGAPLTADEVDENFTNIKTAVEALTEGADGRGITSITASGSTVTFHFSDDTTETIEVPRTSIAAVSISTITTDTLLLQAEHAGRYLRCTNVLGCVVTVAEGQFEAGDEITIRNCAGSDTPLTLIADTGVTLNVPSGFDAIVELDGGVITLKCVDDTTDDNVWDVFGLLAQSA